MNYILTSTTTTEQSASTTATDTTTAAAAAAATMSQPIDPVNTMTNKPPRKRNVITRGRTGCLTCRKRRLKCDENKPGCNNVTSLSNICITGS